MLYLLMNKYKNVLFVTVLSPKGHTVADILHRTSISEGKITFYNRK